MNITFFLCLAIAFLNFATIEGTAAAADTSLGYIENEYVVGFSNNIDMKEVSARIETLSNGKSQFKEFFPRINAATVRIEANEVSGDSLENLIRSSPDVRFIEPNYIYSAIPNSVPNDSMLDGLWYFEDDKIGFPEGWPNSPDTSSIVVAVIDSGIYYEHEDLYENAWKNPNEIPGNNKDDDANGFVDDIYGWDFYNNDSDPTADLVPELILGAFEHPTKKRYEKHGTHVACTIACRAGNSTGIAGVAPNAKIMSLKFLGGAAGSGSLADAIRAISYALDNGAQVINNSWGGGPYSEALKEAFFEAHRSGVVVVAAAGNGGSDQVGDDNDVSPHYPSSYDIPGMISVAASNEFDQLTGFSNYGRTSVDIAAPGSGILSAVPLGDENSPKASSGYEALDGTSMATPIVSGIAASIIAKFPELLHLEVVDRVFSTGDRIAELETKIGHASRVNFRQALIEPELPNIASVMDALSPVEQSIVMQKFQELSPSGKVRMSKRLSGAIQAMTPKEAVLNRIDVSGPESMIVIWNDELTETQKKDALDRVGILRSISPVSEKLLIDEVELETRQEYKDLEVLRTQIPEIRSLELNSTIRLD